MIIVFNDVGIDGRSHARAIRYFHVSEADVGAVPIHPDYKTATPEDLREHWQLMADWKATVREFLFEHHDFNSTMFDMSVVSTTRARELSNYYESEAHRYSDFAEDLADIVYAEEHPPIPSI